MLEDRDYMRQPEYGEHRWGAGFRLRWSWTLALLLVNALVFLAEIAFRGYPPRFSAADYFPLSVEGIRQGFIWQFLTFQFMHAGLLHILLNSFTIFIFGRIIEDHFGGRRFLTLYFTSGVIGGVLQIICGIFWPALGTAVVGASAGAMGLMAAFATLYPDQPLTFFVFIFPVTTRAKVFVWGFAVFSALCMVLPSVFNGVLGGNVANAAHLGGMAMGWFFVKRILRHPVLGESAGEAHYSYPEPAAPADRPADDFADADVDAVLDKISARGINSLTTRERAVLEAARKRMARR
jgi:membrane associated rhomboid family serine protease